MGMFDFLIDKNNVQAEVGKEYVYLHDMVWKPKSLESYPIEYGTIVHSVSKLDNNSFEFKIGDDEQIYCTNYGWSLAVKTDDNLKAIEEYNLSKQKLEQLKQETEILRKNIDTLNKDK